MMEWLRSALRRLGWPTDSLSDDQIVQEVLLWDLKARGVSVLSTEPDDAAIVGGDDPGATRMLIRDVLARIEEHARIRFRRLVS